jgi:mannosyltransferase OCH1-like enzyme
VYGQRGIFLDAKAASEEGTTYFILVQRLRGKAARTFAFFRRLYAEDKFEQVMPDVKPRIPRLLHQIWIGNRPLPDLRRCGQQSWFENHPTWNYKLWTNKEIKGYRFSDANLQNLFCRSSRISEKADLLRYDILNQFGGAVVDLDCRCLEPLDVLHHCYDFYSMIMPSSPQLPSGSALGEENGSLRSCALGSVPGHPVFRRIGELLASKWIPWERQQGPICAGLKQNINMTEALVEVGGRDGNIDLLRFLRTAS